MKITTLLCLLFACTVQSFGFTTHLPPVADTVTVQFGKGNQYCMQPPHTPCLGPQAMAVGETPNESADFLARMYFNEEGQVVMDVFETLSGKAATELASGRYQLDADVPLSGSLLNEMGRQGGEVALKSGDHPVEKLANGHFRIVF